jgi:ApaG protein
MVTIKVTEGIKISVSTNYEVELSKPHQNAHIFSYTIRIENLSDYTVQLLRRRWEIRDSNADLKIVESDGVVGLQPIIEPLSVFEYQSGCNLRGEIGKMSGHYEMERIVDEKLFKVNIPEFSLIANYKAN